MRVRPVNKLLDILGNHLPVARLQRRIQRVRVGIDFVAAGVKVGGIRLESGHDIFKKHVDKLVNFRVVQLQRATRRLGAVPPPRLGVRSRNEIRIRAGNRRRVARHVKLDIDRHTSLESVRLDVFNVCWRVRKSLVVGPLFCKSRKRRDFHWPGLRIAHVEMEHVELVPRQSIDCPQNVFDGVPVSRHVQVETAVLEYWRIPNRDGSHVGIAATVA